MQGYGNKFTYNQKSKKRVQNDGIQIWGLKEIKKLNFQGWKINSKGLLMRQKGRPFQIHEEEYYQENLIRAKPRNQRKKFPSMMLLLITFTNNPNRPTSSQVQATGWS